MKKSNSIIFGVGINDADYLINQYAVENGKYNLVWRCPFYVTWKNMLKRCYSENALAKDPSYRGVTVCSEWLILSNFKAWMISQDWQGKALDKDLLIPGNKVYSPETCVFVDAKINTFTIDRARSRGNYLIGVSWNKARQKFLSCCRNPFTGKNENLGYFHDELEAHLAWKKRKHELACQLADSDLVQDERLAQALRTRYLPDNTQEVKAA